MSAPDWFFYMFSALALLSGLLVVINPFSRNPVTSAMFLVLTIVWLAALFVLLQAFFLAAVQVLVYAGAVIVLFLFVIMLLDLKEEQRRKIAVAVVAMGGLGVAAIAYILISVLRQAQPASEATVEKVGSTSALGQVLFGPYVLPFEIVSLLLLVAIIGTILLSKKELK